MMIDRDDPLTGPFWRAAEEGQLVMSWCTACDDAIWYPEEICPRCRGEVIWRELSGRGVLYSWTHVQMPVNPDFKAGYIAALVVPEEAPGARLVTHVVGLDPDKLECDMSVEVEFKDMQTKGGKTFKAPVFRPVVNRS